MSAVAAGLSGAPVSRKLQVIVIGLPASGKSTMIRGMRQLWPRAGHFGVRLAFLAEVASDTELGRRARDYVKAGKWLPDELVADAVAMYFDRGTFDEGFIIEGAPATPRQAQLLDQLLEARGLHGTAVLYVHAPDDVCLNRALGRVVCATCDGGVEPARPADSDPSRCAQCGDVLIRRWDDDEEPFRRRLKVHHDLVREVLPRYEPDRCVRLDGTLSRDALLKSSVEAVSSRQLP